MKININKKKMVNVICVFSLGIYLLFIYMCFFHTLPYDMYCKGFCNANNMTVNYVSFWDCNNYAKKCICSDKEINISEIEK